MIKVTKEDWQGYKNLSDIRELSACKCGCGFDVIDTELYDIINSIFDMADIIYITSWNRCESHNSSEGGVKNSLHTKGKAIDLVAVKVEDGVEHIMESYYDDTLDIELGLYPLGRVHIGVGSKGFWDNRSEKN